MVIPLVARAAAKVAKSLLTGKKKSSISKKAKDKLREKEHKESMEQIKWRNSAEGQKILNKLDIERKAAAIYKRGEKKLKK